MFSFISINIIFVADGCGSFPATYVVANFDMGVLVCHSLLKTYVVKG